MHVLLTLTAGQEVSALKNRPQYMGCALAESPQEIHMIEHRSMIRLMLIEPLGIHAVLTLTVGQVVSALNPAKVFTERVSGNVSIACP